MGGGASAGVKASVAAATQADLRGLAQELGPEMKAKLQAALAASEGPVDSSAGAGEAAAASTAAPPGSGSAAGEAAPPAEGGTRLELGFVIDEIFRCYDADEDGMIGKDEYLDCCEKIANILDESFNVKARKEKMQWYKDAGAEGTPAEGMYLAKDRWQEAFVRAAHEASGVPTAEPAKLAAWLWDSYGSKLVQLFFPAAKPEGSAPDVPAGPSPSYPVTIPLTDLAKRLEEAKEWGLRPLVLASHCSEVDTYFKYQIGDAFTLDSSSLFLKNKTEIKSLLSSAMYSHGSCQPVLLKMASSSFDWVSFCCEEFPAEIFNGVLWTPAAACEGGFISELIRDTLQDEPKKWKGFHPILVSDFDLDEATAKLADKVPNYAKLATIVVDPASIAKG